MRLGVYGVGLGPGIEGRVPVRNTALVRSFGCGRYILAIDHV